MKSLDPKRDKRQKINNELPPKSVLYLVGNEK